MKSNLLWIDVSADNLAAASTEISTESFPLIDRSTDSLAAASIDKLLVNKKSPASLEEASLETPASTYSLLAASDATNGDPTFEILFKSKSISTKNFLISLFGIV